MTFRKSILLLITLGMIAALVACSSSTHAPITVTLSTVPSTLTVNSQTSITATVANDSANGGVTWSCSGATPCGTFSAATSASGTAVTYTAPAVIASSVTITATSVTTTTISATATTAITAATLANGNYAFSLSGEDANGIYHVVGAFTVASGAITAGEQDFVDIKNPDLFDQINPTGSTVATTTDGNLQIILTTCLGTTCTSADTAVGVAGVETLNGTVLPLSTTGRTFINEFDASASGSGELNSQTTVATSPLATGGYAFVVGGLDTGGDPLAIGGVINVDNLSGAGTISGAGSIFDMNDDMSGTTLQGQTLGASTVTATPDAFGKVTFR